VVEQHSAMRFAWLQEKSGNPVPVQTKSSPSLKWVTVVYNVIWWVPIVLPFTKLISYRAGLIAFLVITIVRATANVVRNNILTLEQAVGFPLRAP